MKIICVDNFDRDDKSDKLIATDVPPFYAGPIAEFLNEKYSGERSSDYFKAVPNDYKLKVWEP